MTNYDPNAPVILTQQEVQSSNANRTKKPRIITQTPVYRAACNLAYFVQQSMMKAPHSLRVPVTNLDALCNDLLRDIAYGYDSRSGRGEALTDALSVVRVIMARIAIMKKMGYMSKDNFNKLRKISDSLTAQLSAWRSSATVGMQ